METGKMLLTAAAALLGLSGCYYYPPTPAAVVSAPAPGIMVPAPSIVVPVVPYRSRFHGYHYNGHRRWHRRR
jgi:hypothetical protein